jgi:serine/threonine protein kinase
MNDFKDIYSFDLKISFIIIMSTQESIFKATILPIHHDNQIILYDKINDKIYKTALNTFEDTLIIDKSKSLLITSLQETLYETESELEQAEEIKNTTEIEQAHSLENHLSKSLNRNAILLSKSQKSHLSQYRYIAQDKLGEGNFGNVWKAFDSDIGREVAIKIFKSEIKNHKRLFEEEIKISGALDHSGIPTIHDVGIDEKGNYYFVMKYISGEPLSHIIEKMKHGDKETLERFPFEKRADLIIQLLRILQAAHKKNIIHRDIKPDNIMIGLLDEVMMIDWGIAINLSENNGENILCGTPFYMSPEQSQKKALTKQSDIYAIGAVFYELMSFSKPIPLAESLVEMFDKIVNHQPTQVDLIFHPVQGYAPSQYRAVIEKSMDKDPKKRFLSADHMLNALINSSVGCVDGICPRTHIHRKFYLLMKWIDFNPYKHIPILALSFIFIILMILSIGVLLGLYL